jgi:hypothetical protein
VTRPVQAWRTTATLGAPTNFNGLLITGGVGFALPQTQAEVVDDAWSTPPAPCFGNASFATQCRQSLFKNVFIVVDSKLLGTRSLNVIADYLALVALADPGSLDGCNDLPSVLDALATSPCPGRGPPEGLTPADAAFLTALYAADPEGRAWAETSDISNRMARILINAKCRTEVRPARCLERSRRAAGSAFTVLREGPPPCRTAGRPVWPRRSWPWAPEPPWRSPAPPRPHPPSRPPTPSAR